MMGRCSSVRSSFGDLYNVALEPNPPRPLPPQRLRVTFFLSTLVLGLQNLWLHKLRSLLTALGIIIGVAAVVTIAGYGEGTKQAALADIRRLGATNIIVRSVQPPASGQVTGGGNQRLAKFGLLYRDLRRIETTVRPVSRIAVLKQVGNQVTRGRRSSNAEVYGTEPELLETASLRVARGRYLTEEDAKDLRNVAVVGDEVAGDLFPLVDPLGSTFRVDDQVFTVVGVLERTGGHAEAGGGGGSLDDRDPNREVHIPLTSATARFGDVRAKRSQGSMELTEVELSRLIIQAPDEDAVLGVAGQVEAVLLKDHEKGDDVRVTVPLELLRQAERTQFLFNVLSVVVAGLSLLVGGIGIMNIMLASVTERTREIGIRRALGARRRDIVTQFLVETTALSGLGGLIGVGLGVGWIAMHRLLRTSLGRLHEALPRIEPPLIAPMWVVIAFLVATGVGVVFGLYPAIKASRQDPIVALRHE